MRLARIEGEVQAQINEAGGRARRAAWPSSIARKRAELTTLTERLATETGEVIAAGQQLQASSRSCRASRPLEAIRLPWAADGQAAGGRRARRSPASTWPS